MLFTLAVLLCAALASVVSVAEATSALRDPVDRVVGEWSPESPAAPSSLTLRRLVTLDALPDTGLVLLGLSAAPAGDSNLLSLAWSKGQSPWFPVWQLTVAGGEGLQLPTGGITLPQVTPVAGHTYEVLMSVDGPAGLLAVRLRDVTEDRTVASGGWRIPSYEGPFYPFSMADEADVEATLGYAPVDMQWEPGTLVGSGFVSLESLEPARSNRVRIRGQGPLPGELQLVVGEAGSSRVIATGTLDEQQTILAIPPYTLPAGRVLLTLQYLEDGELRFASSQPVRVGRVVGSATMRYDREARLFDGGVRLTSESPLSDVSLDIDATVSRMVWDEESRAYTYIPYGVWHTHVEQVRVTPEGVEVPITIPAPTEAAAWRVDVGVKASPDVVVQMEAASAYVSTHVPAEIEPGEAYVVALFPDTQYYAESYGNIYLRMAEWLGANANDLNVAFALHVGDVTDDNLPAQWRVARDAHSLLDGVVPYVITIGNHDYAQNGLVADRQTTLVNEYFKVSDFPHLVETMLPGRIENAYHIFDVAGRKHLVVALEFAPSDAALAWANQVVEEHPDTEVIVVTHAYLHPSTERLAPGSSAGTFPLGQNPATTMNDGEEIWEKLVSLHANMRLVVSGHIHSDAVPRRVTRGVHGNPVLQLLADFQAAERGGDGYLVLLEFAPDGRVTARAYSPYLGEEKRAYDRYGNIVPVTIHLGE